MVTTKKKYEFHSYIIDKNEQDAYNSHAHIIHLLEILFESGIWVSGMSTVWEDTDGCANNYGCDLAIYLLTVL